MHKYSTLFFTPSFLVTLEWCMLLSVTTLADDFKIAIQRVLHCRRSLFLSRSFLFLPVLAFLTFFFN